MKCDLIIEWKFKLNCEQTNKSFIIQSLLTVILSLVILHGREKIGNFSFWKTFHITISLLVLKYLLTKKKNRLTSWKVKVTKVEINSDMKTTHPETRKKSRKWERFFSNFKQEMRVSVTIAKVHIWNSSPPKVRMLEGLRPGQNLNCLVVKWRAVPYWAFIHCSTSYPTCVPHFSNSGISHFLWHRWGYMSRSLVILYSYV